MEHMTLKENPKKITKICEWTGKEFTVDWKYRNQRFINKQAMYEWRKSENRETIRCLTCGKPFERYKKAKHWRNGEKPSYCSNICCVKSEKRLTAARNWALQHQPMNNPQSREKIRHSKLIRYGNPSYNNLIKQQQTVIDKYGVSCYFDLPSCKSYGKRISKFQKKCYEKILQTHPDAELERYLDDAKRAVDILIPSLKYIIECHGDYWHCNPSKYSPYYYNKLVHLTAKEIWKRDEDKKRLLESLGYTVEVIWENKM